MCFFKACLGVLHFELRYSLLKLKGSLNCFFLIFMEKSWWKLHIFWDDASSEAPSHRLVSNLRRQFVRLQSWGLVLRSEVFGTHCFCHVLRLERMRFFFLNSMVSDSDVANRHFNFPLVWFARHFMNIVFLMYSCTCWMNMEGFSVRCKLKQIQTCETAKKNDNLSFALLNCLFSSKGC